MVATSQNAPDDSLAPVAAAFRASAQIYRKMRTPLYAALSEQIAGDPAILALASNGQAAGRPTQLLSAIHYLLLGDPSDPLARFFATLTPDPRPPDQAFADVQRYCREHRDEIDRLLRTRTVQTTYVERCRALLSPLCWIADRAGEPLNLVEIGCSAGVLLTFDKYAYEVAGRGRVGPEAAPLTLPAQIRGGPTLRIPAIGARVGLDLHLVDLASAEQRRWLLALCFPELRDEQARLRTALDTVRQTPIRMLEGDAMAHLKGVLEETPDPLCVFHSACLFYWSKPGKEALETLLLESGRDREIYRLAIEPSERFDSWRSGRDEAAGVGANTARDSGEIIVSRYRAGTVERWPVARNSADYGSIDWIE